jgi:hypothetical protein
MLRCIIYRVPAWCRHMEAVMIYAYAKAITMAFPQEGQTVQPTKLRDAKRFIDLVNERGRDAQLFHAWRP